MNYSGQAIFMDGDMIVRGDIAELWALRDLGKDVQVVKHDYKTRMKEKYLGSKNEDYPCKNWSSVMIFNCNNYPTKKLTPEYIQKSTGAHLHRFEWTENDRVGALPPEWNWLPDEYGANPDAKLLHYTLGTPCFHEFATTTMADEWHRERMLTNYSLQK
jgi:lipopolysaccharide biosynthesis glycosyltransferase